MIDAQPEQRATPTAVHAYLLVERGKRAATLLDGTTLGTVW